MCTTYIIHSTSNSINNHLNQCSFRWSEHGNFSFVIIYRSTSNLITDAVNSGKKVLFPRISQWILTLWVETFLKGCYSQSTQKKKKDFWVRQTPLGGWLSATIKSTLSVVFSAMSELYTSTFMEYPSVPTSPWPLLGRFDECPMPIKLSINNSLWAELTAPWSQAGQASNNNFPNFNRWQIFNSSRRRDNSTGSKR